MAEQRKIALVTGAGRAQGIGFEVSRQLAQSGVRVILSARNAEMAEARSAELRSEELDVTGAGLDITDEQTLRALSDRIAREFGRLDILVNNAASAAAYGEQPATADLKTAREALEVTLFGAWQTVQALLPLLRQSSAARIVNVSSGAGSHGDTVFGLGTFNAMGTSYAVAKAALNALTVKIAAEVKEHGILVNAVCPGLTATFEGGEQMGARPVPVGAAGIVWAALLADDGPTGGFFRDRAPLPW